jgi:hypothetical protein
MTSAPRSTAWMWRCLLVCAWLAWMQGPAWSASYPEPLNLARLTAKAQRIFVGTVLDRRTGKDRGGLFATVYTFRVEQVLKGGMGAEITIKQIGAASPLEDPVTGVITFRLSGIPVYVTGRRYLLFLNGTSASGFTSPVGLGYGAFVVLASDHAVNELNNAGLFRDMPVPAGPARIAGVLQAHTRGPIALSALLDATFDLARQDPSTQPRVSIPTEPSADQVIAGEGLAPRGNIGALFSSWPFRWNIATAVNPGGTIVAVPYDTETGPLGNASNASAREKVAESFSKWAAPATTALRVTSTPGSLGVDVDAICPSATCYKNWYFVFGDGRSPIIFDADGSITRDITGSSCSFGGLGGFQGQTFNGGLTWTIESTALLNGAWLGGVCGNLTLDDFGRTVTHEVGHFLGVDHTIVNGELVMANESFLTFGVPPCSAVEMMLSNAVPGCSPPNVLHQDDVGIVSFLYPSTSFGTTMGQIQGRLFDADGVTPVNCGNIIARNIENPFADAVATITGISRDFGVPPPTQAGSYQAAGLTLGASYTVGVTQIPGFAIGGSNLTDLCDPVTSLPGPEEFYNGESESANPGIDNPNCFTLVPANTLTPGIDIMLNSSAGSSATCGASPTVRNDFDGDGKADILWRHTSGLLALWLMNGGTITGSVGPGTVPTSWTPH